MSLTFFSSMHPSHHSSPVQTTTPTSISDTDDPRSPTDSLSADPPSLSGSMKRSGGLSDGPNARSKSVTVAEGDDTFGVSDGEGGMTDLASLYRHSTVTPPPRPHRCMPWQNHHRRSLSKGLSVWVSAKIATRDAGGPWRMHIRLCTTMPACGVRATLRYSSGS